MFVISHGSEVNVRVISGSISVVILTPWTVEVGAGSRVFCASAPAAVFQV